jgi:hypothetical protein
MKKLLIVLVAFLGLAMPASAQSFGVKLIGIQYNTFDPGQGTGLQLTLGTFFLFSTDVEANYLLGRIPLTTDQKFTFYYGAGAHVSFLGLLNFGALGIGAHGVLGVDYLLQPNLAIGIGVNPGATFYLSGAAGFAPILPYYNSSLYVQFKI